VVNGKPKDEKKDPEKDQNETPPPENADGVQPDAKEGKEADVKPKGQDAPDSAIQQGDAPMEPDADAGEDTQGQPQISDADFEEMSEEPGFKDFPRDDPPENNETVIVLHQAEGPAESIVVTTPKQVWDRRTLYMGDGKSVTKDEFASAQQAAIYLKKVVSQRSKKATRADIVNSNQQLLEALKAEGREDTITMLKKLTEEGA